MLTLGGHNINLFLPPSEYFGANPEWFSLFNGKRVDKQPCFSNKKGTDTMITKIVDYCRSEKLIDTIYLCPNDNHCICKCPLCKDKGFISTYIGFLERLKKKLISEGLAINILHIAYNAQLEWDMLDTIPDENSLDTLLACWGRDYAYDIGNPSNQCDTRFKRTMKRWADACCNKYKTRLTIYEYYGDYWILTGLFPPLIKTLTKDIEFYKSLNIFEMTCLIVPFYLPMKVVYEKIRKKDLPQNANEYKFNSEGVILWANLYVFGRKTWDTGVNSEAALEDYLSAFVGERKEYAFKLVEKLEKNLAGLSGFNTKLFPLNFKLLWLRSSYTGNSSISGKGPPAIIDWDPETDDIKIPKARIETCRKILEKVSANKLEVKKFYKDKNDGRYKNMLDFVNYNNYIVKKIKSICFQSTAQVNIIDHKTDEAVKNLTAALRIEKDINGWDRSSCEEWLKKLQ